MEQEANVYLAKNVVLRPGTGLDLVIDQAQIWDHSYTAGWVETRTRFAQTYGHFEMFARLPQANGVWPAFWLAAENGTWPPEIDVVEFVFAPRGQHPDPKSPDPQSTVETTLHWADEQGQHRFQHAGADPQHPRFHVGMDWERTPHLMNERADLPGYHLYAIDWLPGQIVWFVDHRPVYCMSDNVQGSHRIPSQPMYMILSDSVAPLVQTVPHWAGKLEPDQKFPLDFQIAYVRAYQFNEFHEPPLPLDLGALTPANSEAHAGQKITFHLSLKVGASDLGKGRVVLSLYEMLDPHQFYGVGRMVTSVPVAVPNLEAGHSYPVDIDLELPKTLAPGIYGIDLKANYTDGPGNLLPGQWPRGFHDREATTLVVR